MRCGELVPLEIIEPRDIVKTAPPDTVCVDKLPTPDEKEPPVMPTARRGARAGAEG